MAGAYLLRTDTGLPQTTWPAVAGMVLQRPWSGLCEFCGKQRPTDPHHRVLRSQRGLDVPSNLSAVCRPCHDWCHQHPGMARLRGFMLQSWEPWREIPVTFADGMTALLRDDYGYDITGWP